MIELREDAQSEWCSLRYTKHYLSVNLSSVAEFAR